VPCVVLSLIQEWEKTAKRKASKPGRPKASLSHDSGGLPRTPLSPLDKSPEQVKGGEPDSSVSSARRDWAHDFPLQTLARSPFARSFVEGRIGEKSAAREIVEQKGQPTPPAGAMASEIELTVHGSVIGKDDVQTFFRDERAEAVRPLDEA
jgi:hypothetical protein